MKKILTVVFCAAMLTSCRRHDYRTALIQVPEMKNDACIERVEQALRRVKGVKPESIRVDRRTRTIRVTYESLNLSMRNIEFAVAEAGFQANDIPANKKAAAVLPPECR